MTGPAATPPAGTADLREAIETALHDALSPYVVLSRWTRGGYASNLAVDALLAGPLAALRERAEKAERVSEDLRAERLKLDRRIHNQRMALRENWEITEMRNRDHHRKAVRSRMLALACSYRAAADAAESRLATLAAEVEALRAALADLQGKAELARDVYRGEQHATPSRAADAFDMLASFAGKARTLGGSDAA